MPRIKNTPKQLGSTNPPIPRAPTRLIKMQYNASDIRVRLFHPTTYPVNNEQVTVMNLFDYHLTAEMLNFKLAHLRTGIMTMDIGDHDFKAHFSSNGQFQLTWRFGPKTGFYFSKNGTIVDKFIQE